MVYAIDLDKTLFTCKSVIYKVLTKIQSPSHLNKKLKFKTVSKHTPVNINWINFMLSIFNPNKYLSVNKAIETINKLHQDDDKIILLSSRPHLVSPLKSSVLKWLQDNKVCYDTLIFGCKNKAQFCKMFNVDVLIDDKLKSCLNSNEFGVDAINICDKQTTANKIREQHKDNKNLYVVNSWSPVYLISQMIKYKRSKIPTDFENISKTIYNEYNEFVEEEYNTSSYAKLLTESKLAESIVINGKTPKIINLKEKIENFTTHTPK